MWENNDFQLFEQNLAMDVIEMDAHLTKKEGMSVNQIFEKYGEEYWRNLETNLIIGMKGL